MAALHHIHCWVLYTYRMKLSESDVSISLSPGLRNRAVHTAARHSEGKAGVDLPPLWHQQRWLHQQRGDAVLSHCVFGHQLKSHCSLVSVYFPGDDRDCESHLWHDGQIHLPCAEGRRPTAARGRFLSGLFVITQVKTAMTSIQQRKRKQDRSSTAGLPSANAKLVLFHIQILLQWLCFFLTENG